MFLLPEHDESSSRQGQDPQPVRQWEEVGPDLWPGRLSIFCSGLIYFFFFILINCNWVFLLQWVELQRTKKACKEKSLRLKKIQMFWRQQKKGEIKMFLKTCISYYFIVITVKDKDFKILQTLLLLYLHTGVYTQQAVIQHKLPQQCKHWQWGKCKVTSLSKRFCFVVKYMLIGLECKQTWEAIKGR